MPTNSEFLTESGSRAAARRTRQHLSHREIATLGSVLLSFGGLMYDLDSLAYIAMVVGMLFSFRLSLVHRFALDAVAVTAVVYVALSTVTAFLQGSVDGVYRTVQFFIVCGYITGVFCVVSDARPVFLMRLYETIFAFCLAVYVHIAIYHFIIGRFTSWKFLFDTKIVISLSIVLYFGGYDYIRRRFGPAICYILLVLIGLSTLLSGERKAYVLFIVLFLLSKLPLYAKMLLGITASASLTVFVLTSDADSYLNRQISSIFKTDAEVSESLFYDESDLVFNSDLNREFVNRRARELFEANVLIGVGATGYQRWARDNFLEMGPAFTMNVHGEPNRVPAENGLVGIAVSLAYVLLAVVAIGRYTLMPGRLAGRSTFAFPVYALVFAFVYLWTEAMDTMMLCLILALGYWCSLCNRSVWSYRRHKERRSLRRQHSAQFFPRPHSDLVFEQHDGS